VAAGDNPDRLRSEAAFSMLCGASPIPASSGKTTRHRLNRGGDRQANAALHRIVVVRLRYHQPTRDYMSTRLAQGKTKKRYVAREVFAVLHQLHHDNLTQPLDPYTSVRNTAQHHPSDSVTGTTSQWPRQCCTLVHCSPQRISGRAEGERRSVIRYGDV
jgi:Transposase IS116/IS110/IS902 family